MLGTYAIRMASEIEETPTAGCWERICCTSRGSSSITSCGRDGYSGIPMQKQVTGATHNFPELDNSVSEFLFGTLAEVLTAILVVIIWL